MDPLFVANPSEDQMEEALRLWPELAGKRIRPLLVTAFGDIFVETDDGNVWIASPVELACEPVAASVEHLERLLSDPTWAEPQLLADRALEASDQGIHRPQHQVFAIAPHPCFTGSLTAGTLMPMDLKIWHLLA